MLNSQHLFGLSPCYESDDKFKTSGRYNSVKFGRNGHLWRFREF
jgi:hypothetical protein